ncbi:MAG TPA: hypothetical protein VGM54_06570 [Chthoniobacter sp.]
MRFFKFGFCVTAPLWGLACTGMVKAEESLPTARSKDRYAQLRQHSPFTLAAPTATPSPDKASFAVNWYVSGIGRLGGQYFVTIKSRDLSTQFSLYGEEASKEGVTLVGIDWSESVGKSAVRVRKGTETAKLEFNEAEIHGSSQVAPAGAALPVKPVIGSATPARVPPNQRLQPVGIGQAQGQQRPLRIVQPPANLPTPYPNQIRGPGPAASRRYPVMPVQPPH